MHGAIAEDARAESTKSRRLRRRMEQLPKGARKYYQSVILAKAGIQPI